MPFFQIKTSFCGVKVSAGAPFFFVLKVFEGDGGSQGLTPWEEPQTQTHAHIRTVYHCECTIRYIHLACLIAPPIMLPLVLWVRYQLEVLSHTGHFVVHSRFISCFWARSHPCPPLSLSLSMGDPVVSLPSLLSMLTIM